MDFQSAVISLFFVLNAFGNIPLFAGLLSRYPESRQKKIILRELVIALAILLVFGFSGKEVLSVLGVSKGVLQMTGGFILLYIGFNMIFPKKEVHETNETEPFIVPLAFPLFAGAGSMTNVMTLGTNADSALFLSGVIITAWFLAALVLIWSSQLKNILGSKGMVACEKLGGLIIMLIAVEMLSKGVALTGADLFMLPINA